jgi:glycosyltransferase involved in cell wall biosynthesis
VISRRNAGHWKTARDRLALKVINRLADAWQCNSRAAFDSLVEEAVRADRIEILPNAVDLERLSVPAPEGRLAARLALGLPPAAPVFVSVATLFPVKDPMVLVEAAGRVRQALPDAMFLLVGEGPLRASLMNRIQELRLAGTVRLVGAQLDVRPYLAAADIGLLTSRSEGSSNSLLEYMAMGLPSVLSDIPASRELVDGVFFEPGNALDVAEKILDLWNDGERRGRMQAQYRSRAMEYGLEPLVRRARSYYFELAAEFL